MATQKIETGLIADDAVTSAKLDTNIDIAGTFDVTGVTTLDAGLTVDTTTLVVDATNNRVGIGTASPVRTLEVNSGTANAVARFESTDSRALIEFKDNVGTASIGNIGTNLTFFPDNATETMRIDSSGNVGIGTTSPNYQLTIGDGTDTLETINIISTDASQSRIFFSDASNNGQGRFTYDHSNDSLQIFTNDTEKMRITSHGNLKFIGQTTNFETPGFTYHTNNYLYLRGGSSGLILSDDSGINTIQIIDGASGYINFETSNGSSKMRINSSGKVLIGDSASHTDDLLQIETPASGGGHGIQIRRNDSNSDQGIGHIQFGNNTDTDLARISAKTDGSTDNAALIFSTQLNGGTLTERMRIDSVGEVSIKRAGSGGTGILKALNLNHAGTSVNDGAKISFTAGTSTEGAGIASTGQALNSADLRFYTGGTTEGLRIDSAQVVMRGTTSRTIGKVGDVNALGIKGNSGPSNPMVVFDESDTSVEGGSVILELCFSADTAFSTSYYALFGDRDATQGSISGGGGGTVAFNTSSDLRLKENIVDTSSQLEKIKQVQVRDFNFIGYDSTVTGMIAQELNEVIPEVVTEGLEDSTRHPYGIDYGKLTPYLIKAIQEQQEQIETLKAEIQELKG